MISFWKSYSTSGTKIEVAPTAMPGQQGDIPAPSAHHLYHAAAVVRLSGIADSIHHFHCGVHSGVKAYGVFTALDIIIDGAGNTHTGDSRVGQISGAPEGTIAADNHNAADPKITAGIRRLLHAGPEY